MSGLHTLSWKHVGLASLWCAVVVLGNFFFAEVAYTVLHAFWMSVFWVGFMPVWLACYGMMFASKWLWQELSIGVFGAVGLVSWALTHEMESMRYRLFMSVTFGMLAVFAMTIGYWTERLYRSLVEDGSSRERKSFWG